MFHANITKCFYAFVNFLTIDGHRKEKTKIKNSNKDKKKNKTDKKCVKVTCRNTNVSWIKYHSANASCLSAGNNLLTMIHWMREKNSSEGIVSGYQNLVE